MLRTATLKTRALRHSGRLGVLALLAVVAALAWSIAHGALGAQFERWVADFQRAVSGWYVASPASFNGARLYAIAFVGGLAASLSPCILGMLPVNLAYIGAARAPTRAGAVVVATQFVAGVIVVTAAVGLFASLFFAFFVTYRGQVNIGVGVLMVVMGLWLFGVLRIPLVSAISSIPTASGPFVVGLAFALVASPCASPILIAVLGKTSASGSPLQTVAAMVVYAIGYTAVLWLASVFAGIAVASRRLLAYGELITRIAAAALLMLGLGTAVYGVRQL